MRIETRDVEGCSYKMVTIYEGERAQFVGTLDLSPCQGFAIANGSQLGSGERFVMLIAGGRVAWALRVANPMDVRITEGGYAAFIDEGKLVITDVTGELMRLALPAPRTMERFSLAPGRGFIVESGRVRRLVDYEGGLTEL